MILCLHFGHIGAFERQVSLDLGVGRAFNQVRPEADGFRLGVITALQQQLQQHRYYDHDGQHKDKVHVYGNSQPRPIARSHRADLRS